MKRSIWTIILLTIVVDAFYFDVVLKAIPIANSKMILAVIGLCTFVFKGIQNRTTLFSRRIFISAILAVIFSLWCYFAIVANGSYNREFVHYYASFATWVGGAFGVYVILKTKHERVDLSVLTRYLALVCTAQCALALIIDNVPFVRNFVDATFVMATDFLERGNRLYGIGCALDPAGVRFSGVQVLIAHQLAQVDAVRRDSKKSTQLIIAFLAITIVGSMISRTTIVGTMLGLVYILLSNFRIQKGGFVSTVQTKSIFLLFFLIAIAATISVILYNSNQVFQDDLRFGFEGFFNWIETGSFRTGSTDHLRTMWVWPTTRRGWIIGEGRVGVFETNSDIGYCNYILYCGLIGMAIYSFYYIYNHLSLIKKFDNFIITAFLLVAVTFIVWAKVTTDIFLVDALLFCIDGDKESPLLKE